MQKENSKIKKESFMQGVMALIVSQVLIKLLGLLYTLYLTNKQGFGDTGNAIYLSAYQIYALLLTLSSIGVPGAISKLVAEKVAVHDYRGAEKLFKIAFVLFAIIGLIGTFGLFFGADIIANKWLEIPESKYTLIALSPAIFFVAISAVFRGYFNGMSSIRITAKSQTLEQVFKALLTIIIVEGIFVATNGNTVSMATGANIATTVSIFLSFAYIYLYYKISKKDYKLEIKSATKYKEEKITSILKAILAVAIPMSLSAILSSFNKNIDSFTVVRGLKTFMTDAEAKVQYGILSGKVDTLTNLPLSINVALATALVPAISSAIAKKDDNNITKRVSFSLLLSMLIGLPSTLGMIVFAGPILNLLFPNASDGTLIFQLISVTVIFTILDQTINGTLQGIGKVMVPAKALGIGMIVKLILNVVLIPIPQIGVNGAAIGSIACHMIAFIIAFNVLRKSIKLDLKFNKFILKPFLATIMMLICSYFIYSVLKMIIMEKIATIVALIFAVIVYILLIIIMNILNREDIYMIPYGIKIYEKLLKFGIYKN